MVAIWYLLTKIYPESLDFIVIFNFEVYNYLINNSNALQLRKYI